jgi:abortive infection bacteriophage resistance protein
MKYDKPPKKIDEQVDLLKQRGLIVEDEKRLKKYLKNISYYHFSIYFKHFQDDDNNFIKGTTFEDVLNIYVFDQKLRLLLLDVLERIEKSFKCRFAYEMSVFSKNSFWLSEIKYFKNDKIYNERVVEILEDLRYSKEIYIKHYYETYDDPRHPPIWMVIEALTFGQSVMIYSQLKPEYQKIIADTYGINKKFISNWLHALAVIRNFCAHHCRLWNREMVILLSQKHGLYKKLFNNLNGNRLFNYLLIIHIINCKFNPDSKWLERLEGIISEYNINISHMGFPEDWRERFGKIRKIEKSLLDEN